MSFPLTPTTRNRVNQALVGSGVVSWNIVESSRTGKKWKAVVAYPDHVETVHFGASDYPDYYSLSRAGRLKEARERRTAFRNRFASLIQKSKDDPTSPMFWSYFVLW